MMRRIWALIAVLTVTFAFTERTAPAALGQRPVPIPIRRTPRLEDLVTPMPPGPDSRPEATTTLRISSRTRTAITLKWHDRNDFEDGNRLFRHTLRESFRQDAVEVTDLGPLNSPDGWVEYTDTGVSADARYCYEVRPYNVHGTTYSSIVCDPCIYLCQDEDRGPMEGPCAPRQVGALHSNHYSDEGADRITRSDAACFVENLSQLRTALGKVRDGDVIYVDDSANIEITGPSITVPRGVTLASGRGLNDSSGAHLYTRSNMEELSPLIRVGGSNVRITGLRIEGPSVTKAAPIAIGIQSKEGYDCLNPDGFCLEIDNSELYGWPKAAIEIRGYKNILGALSSPAARRRVADRIHIHDNYIHHNQSKRQGSSHFGYGIVVRDAYALIEKNVFDFNRHAIAGGGNSESGYISRHNLVLEGQSDFKNRWWQPALNTHAFDMHMYKEWEGGCCRPAGEFIHIHDNSFQFRKKYQNLPLVPYVPAIKIRGRPETPSIVERNSFRHDDIDDAVKQTNQKGRLMVFNNVTGYDSRGDYGIGDFNGDGRDDLFQAAGSGFYYSSGGRFVWRHMLNSGESLSDILFGDFNCDGRTDLLRALSGRWEVSFSGTSDWTHLNNSGIGVEGLRVGDFDGDDCSDDIFKTSGGKWYVSIDGAAAWGDPINSSAYGVDKLRLGDFGDGNCDGRTDVFRASGGKWYVSWGGTSRWGDPVQTSDYGVEKLRFGDFNGDGCTDVLRSEDGKWYYSSGGTRRWTRLHGAGWSLSEIIVGDFTGDGKTDIARYKSRKLYVSPGGEGRPYIVNADFRL